LSQIHLVEEWALIAHPSSNLLLRFVNDDQASFIFLAPGII